MKNIIKSFTFAIFISTIMATTTNQVSANENKFSTGWWLDYTQTDLLQTYASQGVTLVHMNGGGWLADQSYGHPRIKKFLDEANKYGIKVILSMTKSTHTPYGVPVNDFINTLNTFKTHPALFGWYIADEPERYNNSRVDSSDTNQADDWKIPFGYINNDPGYYQLIKQHDPNHPAFISFNMIHHNEDIDWQTFQNFLPATDIVGMHNYPFWSPPEHQLEFSGGDVRVQYDKWKYVFEKTKQAGKSDFIATAQAIGSNSQDSIYRDPTVNELRYQVFSAIVVGVKHVLYWRDSNNWTNDNVRSIVTRIIGETQSIGAQMNNGVTNDPNLKVSINNTDQLVYRYGIDGTKGAILAVNIANRQSRRGQSFNDMKFSLPNSIKALQVEVVGENRTINISSTDNSFSDSFAPFQVHIYKFDIQQNNSPSPKLVVGDATGEGDVNLFDYSVLVNNYNKSTTNGFVDADFNLDQKVDGQDYVLWLNNYSNRDLNPV